MVLLRIRFVSVILTSVLVFSALPLKAQTLPKPDERKNVSKDIAAIKPISKSKLSILPSNIPYTQEKGGGRLYDATIVPMKFFEPGEVVELSARTPYSGDMFTYGSNVILDAKSNRLQFFNNGNVSLMLPKSGHLYRADLYIHGRGRRSYNNNPTIEITAAGTRMEKVVQSQGVTPIRLIFEVSENAFNNQVVIRFARKENNKGTVIFEKAVITRLESIPQN